MLGEGILKGLAETAKNFFGSYVSKDRLTTVQFPEERLPQAEAARNFPFLVYDGDDWQAGLRCVACQIVEVCPFDAIEMDTAFELSTDNRFDGLLWRKAQLAKSNDYFHKIHPLGATEIDERLTAAKIKAETKTKPLTDSSPSSPLPQADPGPNTTR